MALTPAQIKGRIKNIAQKNKADARVLMRLYMMERFLERISNSRYRDNFIIKGGILVTSMVGVAMRSTMDIDASLRNEPLSFESAKTIINEIIGIDLSDNVEFNITEMSSIMDEMEYPGIRFSLVAKLEQLQTPLKIDISTGDIITPRAVEYEYELMLENRNIRLWSYNLETVLGEKLQTILSRGVLNTRMRDFYDIHVLLLVFSKKLDFEILWAAFSATCEKRDTTKLLEDISHIVGIIKEDKVLSERWKLYRTKYSYAAEITYEDVCRSVCELGEKLKFISERKKGAAAL